MRCGPPGLIADPAPFFLIKGKLEREGATHGLFGGGTEQGLVKYT